MPESKPPPAQYFTPTFLASEAQSDEDLVAIEQGLAQSLAGLARQASEFFSEFEERHQIREQDCN